MYNHTPQDYKNPFKMLIDHEEVDSLHSNEEDVFYEDEFITAFISSRSEIANQGNVLIVPNEVYENIYDIPDDLLVRIHVFAKQVAIAMKEVYKCDGVSLRQHNEPAGNQEVWHYHLHVIPRYEGDNLYAHYSNRLKSNPEVRAEYAVKLQDYFNDKK